MKNKNYIVLLSAFIACTSLGMATDERKQYLLKQFHQSEEEVLSAETERCLPKYLNPVLAVREAIVADVNNLQLQGSLTVKDVSTIIEDRIAKGVTQDVKKRNLNSSYRDLYVGIKSIALEVQDIKSVSISNEGTLICVEHSSASSDNIRIFQEKDTMNWKLLLKLKGDICVVRPEKESGDHFQYIHKGACPYGCRIANKNICFTSEGILILYPVTTEDIAEYLIKKAQAVGK